MKTVYLMRHGIAVAVGERGVASDAARMLSEEGRRKTADVADGLRSLECVPDRVFSSPLVRARETAEVVANRLGGMTVETADELAPGVSPADVVRWLSRVQAKSVLLVGHLPDLPDLASLLITGGTAAGLHMRRAAVCCITFETGVHAGAGTLEWLLQPSVLRRLG
jgi:phosphohistidine phosphatase